MFSFFFCLQVEEVQAGEEVSISETGRLFVRNLAYTASEAELSEAFGRFGDLTEVHLVLDRCVGGGGGGRWGAGTWPDLRVRGAWGSWTGMGCLSLTR